MRTGVDLPQEDEFALCAMGAPTPYRRVAFPNQPAVDTELIGMDDAAPEQSRRFKEGLMQFLRALTVKYSRPLALKSPTHTGRIGVFADWFPQAKFVHIARHPFDTIPSTIHLWRTLETFQGFQTPSATEAERIQAILETFSNMYAAYFAHRQRLVAENRLVEIRYEQLVADPIATIRYVYEQLGLAGGEQLGQKVQAYFAERRGHKVNPRQLAPELQEQIEERLAEYLQKFDYAE